MFATTTTLQLTPTPIPPGATIAIMDKLAELDIIATDLADWSVGANQATGQVDIDLTIHTTDPNEAINRTNELIQTALDMLKQSHATTNSVHADRIHA